MQTERLRAQPHTWFLFQTNCYAIFNYIEPLEPLYMFWNNILKYLKQKRNKVYSFLAAVRYLCPCVNLPKENSGMLFQISPAPLPGPFLCFHLLGQLVEWVFMVLLLNPRHTDLAANILLMGHIQNAMATWKRKRLLVPNWKEFPGTVYREIT